MSLTRRQSRNLSTVYVNSTVVIMARKERKIAIGLFQNFCCMIADVAGCLDKIKAPRRPPALNSQIGPNARYSRMLSNVGFFIAPGLWGVAEAGSCASRRSSTEIQRKRKEGKRQQSAPQAAL
jgi:hypothetical protein